jgi:hypothetical protein
LDWQAQNEVEALRREAQDVPGPSEGAQEEL